MNSQCGSRELLRTQILVHGRASVAFRARHNGGRLATFDQGLAAMHNAVADLLVQSMSQDAELQLATDPRQNVDFPGAELDITHNGFF